MKKQILAVAAAAAVTAATAVPAMAFENEFHGMFRLFGVASNLFDAGSGAAVYNGTPINSNPLKSVSGVLTQNPRTNTYVEQRARILYAAKASDDLKLVTQFEIDYSRWGDSSYSIGRNTGAALGADQINIETKSVYLDFNIPSTPVNVKVGMQPYGDAFKGILVNNDAAGIVATAKAGKANVKAGWFRFDDVNPQTGQYAAYGAPGALTTTNLTNNYTYSNPNVGAATRDFALIEGSGNLSDKVKIGGAYYFVRDDRGKTYSTKTAATTALPETGSFHTIGLSSEFKFDPATFDVFALYQFGQLVDNTHLSAWAAQASAKVKAGPGTGKVSFLYTSGDSNPGNKGNGSHGFQSIQNFTSSANSENNYYNADMFILLRNKWNINSERAIVYTMNNNDQGLIGGFIGYDVTKGKVFGSVNAGFAAVARANETGAVTATKKGSNYLGTEFNAEIGYKLYDNLSASFQAAYVVLGDYFKNAGGTDNFPHDPYLTRIMLNYTF